MKRNVVDVLNMLVFFIIIYGSIIFMNSNFTPPLSFLTEIDHVINSYMWVHL